MLHPVSFISRKLLFTELNYNNFDKEMLAIVFWLNKSRYFLQGAEHQTIVYSYHQNLTHFKTAVSLNRGHARWAEKLVTCNFNLFYRKRTSNATADTLSRCPVYTSTEGGTTAAGAKMLFRKEHWLEVRAMQIEDHKFEMI